MNSEKWILIVTFFLITSFSFSIVYLQHEYLGLSTGFSSSPISSSSSDATGIVTEGNSTFSNSTQRDDRGISKVIVIPYPTSDSHTVESPLSNTNNESDLLTSDLTKTASIQNNGTSLESQGSMNPQKNNNANNLSSQNQMQRGEYKVDDNGIHYYNINNCSLVKGSSGIGDLSECEDDEREIQEELNG
jgi:hypothetical protein